MQVRDVMHKETHVINVNRPVIEAARIMKDYHLGCLPVEENDRMVGMLTDRDIVMNAIAENREPSSTPVRACMSAGITYCYDDEDLESVCHKLGVHSIRRIPVVNGSKRLVGILSVDDIAPSSIDDATFHEMMCSIVTRELNSDPVLLDEQVRADRQEIDVMTWEGYNDLPVTME